MTAKTPADSLSAIATAIEGMGWAFTRGNEPDKPRSFNILHAAYDTSPSGFVFKSFFIRLFIADRLGNRYDAEAAADELVLSQAFSRALEDNGARLLESTSEPELSSPQDDSGLLVWSIDIECSLLRFIQPTPN